MKLLTIILGVLCLGQLWGTAVAIALAAAEIYSIVVSGPIFTVVWTIGEPDLSAGIPAYQWEWLGSWGSRVSCGADSAGV